MVVSLKVVGCDSLMLVTGLPVIVWFKARTGRRSLASTHCCVDAAPAARNRNERASTFPPLSRCAAAVLSRHHHQLSYHTSDRHQLIASRYPGRHRANLLDKKSHLRTPTSIQCFSNFTAGSYTPGTRVSPLDTTLRHHTTPNMGPSPAIVNAAKFSTCIPQLCIGT